MQLIHVVVAAGTPSIVLRLAAAFFFVAVAGALVYVLIRLGRTLNQTEKLLADVDGEIVPLLKQATETLDNVNDELEKLDVVMGTVVDVTEKVDSTTRAMEAAISVPAKKAAAWGAGVSQAVSSLFSRHDAGAESDASEWAGDTGAPWRRDASTGPETASPSAFDAAPADAPPATPVADAVADPSPEAVVPDAAPVQPDQPDVGATP